jgi:hypothetical protein
MSNFPLNSDRYKYTNGEEFNGCPLTYNELAAFADKILYWHTNNNTSDFSQSGDGFDDGVRNLVFGLAELLSDPNAIKRLETTGREVKRAIDMIYQSDYISEKWENAKQKIKEFDK